MKRDIAALADGLFDLLIIGGGIIGAGVARDAAMRGLSVALVEQADFASGTSSKSSKLIHGGFRYLEQYAFGLVRESCRERRILQEIAPHLVHPVQFLLPVYEGDPRSLWTMRIGMTLYDMLAMYGNTGAHRTLSATEAAITEPGLNRHGLRGAIAFYDCQEDDARLCVDTVSHAAELGARCANYCRVEGFAADGPRIVAAKVSDRLTGNTFDVRAKCFLNAAGPWVEQVAGMADAAPIRLSRTKGTHILLPNLTAGHGVFFQSNDRRMIFVIPWLDCTLVGTTDTDYAGLPEDVAADEADIEYLLQRTAAVLPRAAVRREDVITAFAGVRPLLASDKAHPSARSREHKVLRQGENLVTIAGGKYTTYRAIAQQAVDAVFAALGKKSPRCRTAEKVIPNRRPALQGERIAAVPEVFQSDIAFACEKQMATSVSDVMWRRTGLALSRAGGVDVARGVARMMTPLLGWSDGQCLASVDQYLAERKSG
jgi:glycerol-3-phosphate dehydrogenase